MWIRGSSYIIVEAYLRIANVSSYATPRQEQSENPLKNNTYCTTYYRVNQNSGFNLFRFLNYASYVVVHMGEKENVTSCLKETHR